MLGGVGGDESPDPDGGDHRPGARSDAELIDLVRRTGPGPGDTVTPSEAFAELYDRHVAAARALARQLSRSSADADDLVASAFTRLLEAMRAGRGPTEAFRAYLLTSLRHHAYDRTRAERRVEVTDDIGDVVGVDPERTIVGFADPALAGLERTLAARAFATLPERWQAVLWHLEVEGDTPADIAPLFGLTANAVSALAYRAREGLRQAYLQEHLSSGSGRADRRHRETEQRLGAYTRGGLARRDAARVEAHLAECAECRALAGELREVNSGMVRAVVAPLVLGAGVVGYLASRGSSPEYLTATSEIATPGRGSGGVLGALGLAHPAVLATLVVTAPGSALAVAAAGVAGIVGAAGVVGAVATGALVPPQSPQPPPPHGTTSAPPAGSPSATPPLARPPSAPAPPAPSPLAPSPFGSGPTRTPFPSPPARPAVPTTTPAPTTTLEPAVPLPSTPVPTSARARLPSSPTTTASRPPARTSRAPVSSSPSTPTSAPWPDEPTRPLPLLDTLGRVLAEVTPTGRR